MAAAAVSANAPKSGLPPWLRDDLHPDSDSDPSDEEGQGAAGEDKKKPAAAAAKNKVGRRTKKRGGGGARAVSFAQPAAAGADASEPRPEASKKTPKQQQQAPVPMAPLPPVPAKSMSEHELNAIIDAAEKGQLDTGGDDGGSGNAFSSAVAARRAQAMSPEQQELSETEQLLLSVRKSLGASVLSVLSWAILGIVTLVQVQASVALQILVVIIFMALTAMVSLIAFYHKSLLSVVDAEVRGPFEVDDGRLYQKYASKFMRIVIMCLVMILVETVAAFEIMFVIIFNLRRDATTECPSGVFDAFSKLTTSGQAIYVFLFLLSFAGFVCFYYTTRTAYAMNLFYLKLHLWAISPSAPRRSVPRRL